MNKFSQKGVALYAIIIIMAIVLGIVLGVSAILIKQIKIIRGMEDSARAYYNAETGIEDALRAVKGTSNKNNLGSLYYVNGEKSTPEYDVKIVCCKEGTQGCIFGDAQAGACAAIFDTCPAGIPQDATCKSPGFCIHSKGNYNGVERVLEVKYGVSEPLKYDFLTCGDYFEIINSPSTIPDVSCANQQIVGLYWVDPWSGEYTYNNKSAQPFRADQDYSVRSITLPLKRAGVTVGGVIADCGLDDGQCPAGCTAANIFDPDCLGKIRISIQKVIDTPDTLGALHQDDPPLVNKPDDDAPDGIPICSTTINGDNLLSLCDPQESACATDPNSTDRMHWRYIVFNDVVFDGNSKCDLEEDVTYAVVIENPTAVISKSLTAGLRAAAVCSTQNASPMSCGIIETGCEGEFLTSLSMWTNVNIGSWFSPIWSLEYTSTRWLLKDIDSCSSTNVPSGWPDPTISCCESTVSKKAIYFQLWRCP